MRGFEQLPVTPLEQASTAIGSVSLGMPMVRDINNPFMTSGLYEEQDKTGDWRDLSLCNQTDPEIFFPEKGGSTRDAKAVCNRCEVRDVCLDNALANNERFGILGGKSERERRKLQKQMREAEQAG